MADKTIFQLMVEVVQQVGAVGKDEFNQMQKWNFRGIDAVVNHTHPVFAKVGVFVVPELVNVEYSQATTAKGSIVNLVRGVVSYHFYGPLGDKVTTTVAAESMDSGDKATAKMMSVAFRTALLQALSLPTTDKDPDHDIYEPAKIAPKKTVETTPTIAETRKKFLSEMNYYKLDVNDVDQFFLAEYGIEKKDGTIEQLNAFMAKMPGLGSK
jgi:hypothetical protein